MRKFLLRAFILTGSVAALGTATAQSQEDQMQRFGRTHPQCQQWTDWQRLCSRTGPGGSVACRRDLEVRVKPSAPFCVAGAWRDVPWHVADTPAEQKSRMRFCAAPDSEDFGTKKIPICREYNPRRPFNGSKLATIYDERCQVVRMISREADVCRSDGKSGAPSCRQALRDYRAARPLYCAQWKPVDACGAPVLSAPAPTLSGGLVVAPNRLLSGTPVWGPYCASLRKGNQ